MFSGLRSDSMALSHVWLRLPGKFPVWWIGLPGIRYFTGSSGFLVLGTVNSFTQNRTGVSPVAYYTWYSF